MKVIAIKNFLHDKLGRVTKDSIIELGELQAQSLEKKGIVKTYATKVVNEKPIEQAVEADVETKAKVFRKKKQLQETE